LRLAKANGKGVSIVEANLRLLDGADGREPAPAVPRVTGTSDGPAPAAKHVTLVKRVPLVRMAPGVQLLVTRPIARVASATGG
jgi:hypothetical protein